MKLQSDTNSKSHVVSIPFDALMLGAVVRELSDQLPGGKIQDIRHPETNELQIGIHTSSGTHRLLISIDARFARVHLTGPKAPNASTPTEFCSALRRHIEGGRVESIIQVGVDRIMEIRIESDAGDGSRTHHWLIAELMGKHSNIILVDDTRRIIESAKRVSHRINRVRETLPGLTYARPPGIYDAPLPSSMQIAESIAHAAGNDVTQKTIATAIRKCAPYISPFLAAEIALRCSISDRDADAYRLRFGPEGFTGQATGELRDRLYAVFEMIFARRTYRPVASPDSGGAGAYPIPMLQIAVDQQTPIFSLNQALSEGYANLLRNVNKQDAADRLASDISRELARQSHTAASLSRTIEEASRAELLTQSGNLVLANLWQIKTGDKEIDVTDFYDENGGSRTIRLNPELSPQENAEALFDRARRARMGLETARVRLGRTLQALVSLNEAASSLQALIDDPNADSGTIRDLSQNLTRDGLLRTAPNPETKTAPQFQGHRIRREITPEGYEVLVGESATANDFLTTRIARPNDLWLHVRSASSGHVVIRTNGKPETVPQGVLERAAIISARHSAQKHSSLVAVDYTLKKYVRKPRGAAPGSVVIEREKTIHVSPVETVDK